MNTLLNNLPDIDFVAKDSDQIISEVIEDMEKGLNRSISVSDPIYLLALVFCKYLTLQRNYIDYAAKQNLVKYAVGEYLDNIGAFTETVRITDGYASTTLCFTISAALSYDLTIPAGTRACTAKKIYFATDEAVVISAGETQATVTAYCTTSGTIGNDIPVGDVCYIVDIFSYFSSVSNTTISSGGTAAESDEAFRERIVEAPEAYSVAGPIGAYEYLAKSVSSDISDVKVVAPAAGCVDIVVLLADGEAPGEELLEQVREVCSADDTRPLTDYVTTSAPEKVGYNIDITYYINDDSGTTVESVQNSIAEAVENYKTWQSEKLKRHIDPTELIKLVKNAGADYVEVRSPNAVKLEYNQVANCESESVIYGGEWDD